jgi:hypothetical protein
MLKEEILPTQYHIEVYEGSFQNDPFWGVQSSTPFPSVNVGEVFRTGGLDVALYDPPKENQIFLVKEIEHIFWQIKGSHIGHKLMISLELSERNTGS